MRFMTKLVQALESPLKLSIRFPNADKVVCPPATAANANTTRIKVSIPMMISSTYQDVVYIIFLQKAISALVWSLNTINRAG